MRYKKLLMLMLLGSTLWLVSCTSKKESLNSTNTDLINRKQVSEEICENVYNVDIDVDNLWKLNSHNEEVLEAAAKVYGYDIDAKIDIDFNEDNITWITNGVYIKSNNNYKFEEKDIQLLNSILAKSIGIKEELIHFE